MIIGVVDDEVGVEVCRFVLNVEDADADAMEGAHVGHEAPRNQGRGSCRRIFPQFDPCRGRVGGPPSDATLLPSTAK